MVATEPPKKLQKVEQIKQNSNYLDTPLRDELKTEKISISPDAVVVMKYHGSYMQDNRDNRQKGKEKEYQFMLRLKGPAGEVTPELYKTIDDLSTFMGQNDLRATTRQAWQIHGILKKDLKTVINTIMKAGSSTVGACGDVSRNVMAPAAPINDPAYVYARKYSKVLAELFKPLAPALADIWTTNEDGEKEKIMTQEYWQQDIQDLGIDVKEAMLKDSGRGIITADPVEPLYGARYLPRKFKIAITAPGDNSIDIYTNDIGLVTIVNDDGELEGFNVMVGGGMGRTHNKDSTFARAADHMGFVRKDDIMELCKAVLAAQRDHGNRDVRANARMKYLVHELGIDVFKSLVEGYFGKPVEPWRPLPEWEFKNWDGWHEQGDGKLFLGINIQQGRVKDYEGTGFDVEGGQIKTALRKIVDEFNLHSVLTSSQSMVFRDIDPKDKDAIDAILKEHRISPVESLDRLVVKSIACPALPLCGLAVTEAERIMPEFLQKMRALLVKVGLPDEEIQFRITGCPNGCARPYMAECALVGDGPEMYQIWLGGSPANTRVASAFLNRVKWSALDDTLEPIFQLWADLREPGEAFGDFVHRLGFEAVRALLDPSTGDAVLSKADRDEAASVSPAAMKPAFSVNEQADFNTLWRPVKHVTISETRAKGMVLKDTEALNEAKMSATYAKCSVKKLHNMQRTIAAKFQETHGVKLSVMSAIVKATASALKTYPGISGEINDNSKEIRYPSFVDISIDLEAVAGLTRPVIRDCDKKSVSDLAKDISELENRLSRGEQLEEGESTFTISNGGLLRTLTEAPFEGTRRRPVLGMQLQDADNMHLSLTYDHRLISKFEADEFLSNIAAKLEEPFALLLDL